MEYLVAVISAVTAIVVAVVERRTRREDERWELNTREHEALVSRMDMIGSNLGRSIDRVEENLTHHIIRLENKVASHDDVLFAHLADHAAHAIQIHQEADAPVRRKRKQEP